MQLGRAEAPSGAPFEFSSGTSSVTRVHVGTHHSPCAGNNIFVAPVHRIIFIVSCWCSIV